MFGKDKRPPMAAVVLVVLVGCASGREKPPAAHARPVPSVSAPASQPAATLQPDAVDAPAATSVADAQRSAEMASSGGHEGHGSTYVHVDAGRETGAQEMSHDHHGHDMEEMTEVYACPMHPEVTSTVPGKCPKCGMELVKRRKE